MKHSTTVNGNRLVFDSATETYLLLHPFLDDIVYAKLQLNEFLDKEFIDAVAKDISCQESIQTFPDDVVIDETVLASVVASPSDAKTKKRKYTKRK